MSCKTHSDPQVKYFLLMTAYYTAQSIGQRTTALLQDDLAALWQMSFNSTKCSVMRVTAGRRKKVCHSSYRLHGQKLEVVDSSIYLGVKVTSYLTWSSHIADVGGKDNRSLGFLRRNSKQCTKKVKAATYTTMSMLLLYGQGDIKTLLQLILPTDHQGRE